MKAHVLFCSLSLGGRWRGPLLALGTFAFIVGCRDDTGSLTEPASPPPLATAAAALVFWQLSAGGDHTCGVTTGNRAYCWGTNTYGQLGDGTTTTRLRPVAVATTLRFRQISAGGFHTCGVTTDYRAYCWGANRPDGLAGGEVNSATVRPGGAYGPSRSPVGMNSGRWRPDSSTPAG